MPGSTSNSIDLFKDELVAIRSTLNLKQIHPFGQSWGGCLALEHTLSQATGLASLILANTPANIQQFVTEAYNLMNDLPADIKEIIRKHETESKQAMEVFKGLPKNKISKFNNDNHYIREKEAADGCLFLPPFVVK